ATNVCGNVCKSRKHLPKIEQKLKKEVSSKCAACLLAINCCHQREVWMLTSCHNSG
ncbi:unnamed protein product, partial [Candidula unifasciata]